MLKGTNRNGEEGVVVEEHKFDEGGFDSGEDDDLIEIGRHKGATLGAKSVFQNLESLTSDQIIKEDRYAATFKMLEAGKASGTKSEVDYIKDAIEQCYT